MKKKELSARETALSALVAALYVGISFAFAPISYGPVQFRVAEALTLLPFCMPGAAVGLFIGCLLSNVLGGFGIIDIIFGGAATLAAAHLTSKAKNVWLAALPPVVINAVVVGFYVAVLSGVPILAAMLCIGVSQAVICYAVGVPLALFLGRSPLFEKYTKKTKNGA